MWIWVGEELLGRLLILIISIGLETVCAEYTCVLAWTPFSDYGHLVPAELVARLFSRLGSGRSVLFTFPFTSLDVTAEVLKRGARHEDATLKESQQHYLHIPRT